MTRVLSLVAMLLVLPSAHAAYRCVDQKGVTHIGDTPPPGCATVMMYEVTPKGKVLREIPPSLTPEQIKVKELEAERRKAADKAAAEQRRKDLALLNTYGTEKEFDVARDRNIEPIKARIASVQDRLAAIEKRITAIEEESEFYKAGKSKGSKGREVPATLTQELARLQKERDTLAKALPAHEKEIEQVRTRFDTDKQRWMTLKVTGPTPEPAKPALTPAAAGKPPASDKAFKKN
jgi:hypothetical protein